MDDAKDAIETAELLYKNERFGKSAFNAQQAVELSIKSYVKYFDLIHENQNNIFKTHIPSKILLKDILSVIVESLNKNNLREMDELVTRMIDISFKKLDKTKRLMKKVDDDKELLKELWKISLGITPNESRVKSFFDEIKEFKEMTFPFEMIESFIIRMRNVPKSIFDALRRERKSHLISIIKKFTMDKTQTKGIPSELTNIIFSDIKGKDLHDAIQNTSNFSDSFDIIDYLYGKDGILDMVNSLGKKSEEIIENREREITLRMFYLASLSETVLLTYPHEELGRYSGDIDGKTTEEWYIEKKENLKGIINNARTVFNRTEALILNS